MKIVLIDTHAHLDFSDFDRNLEKVINKAKENGVKYIINIGTDFASSRKSLELTQNYNNVFATAGVHPHQAKIVDQQGLKVLKDLAKADKVIGIGETGLDFHYDYSPRDKQIEVFEQLIKLSKSINLPLIIHSREAEDKTLDILTTNRVSKGVFHCFTGDLKLAEKILNLGLYVSINGILTFKNAKTIQNSVKEIPLEKILIETDSPYLTPEPHRGHRNEPAYVKYVVQKIADIKKISFEKVAEITTKNARAVFNI